MTGPVRQTAFFRSVVLSFAAAVSISGPLHAGAGGYDGTDRGLWQDGGSLDAWRSFLCDDSTDPMTAAGGGFAPILVAPFDLPALAFQALTTEAGRRSATGYPSFASFGGGGSGGGNDETGIGTDGATDGATGGGTDGGADGGIDGGFGGATDPVLTVDRAFSPDLPAPPGYRLPGGTGFERGPPALVPDPSPAPLPAPPPIPLPAPFLLLLTACGGLFLGKAVSRLRA